MGKFGCPVFNCEFNDERNWETHLAGKKHQIKQHRNEMIRKKDENGLFVKGFAVDASSEELHNFLSKYGEIIDFYRSAKKPFLFVSYKEKSVTETLLSSSVSFKGRPLRIRRKRPISQSYNTPTVTIAPQPQRNCSVNIRAVDYAKVHVVLTSGGTLEEFLSELSAAPEEQNYYKTICNDLENCLVTRLGKCTAHNFGSTRTGLNMKGSDLDVYVELQDVPPDILAQSYLDGASLPIPGRLVRVTANVLSKHTHKFSTVRPIIHAKTPIVKCVYKPYNISCDISFKNMLGVKNSLLISHYMSLDSRVYPYFMIIKYWASKHKFSGCGKLSNYALVTLAAYYLQQLEPPVLPNVLKLQALNAKKFQKIDGWICNFCDDPKAVEPSKNNSNLYELLSGFFTFYRDFPVQELVICPFLGVTIPRLHFIQSQLLPEVVRVRMNDVSDRPFKITSDMCVQDPFELSHNVTASMGRNALKDFLAYCDVAAKLFKDILKEPEDKKLQILHKLYTCKPGAEPEHRVVTNTKMIVTINAENNAAISFLALKNSNIIDSENSKTIMLETWFSVMYDLLLDIFKNIMKFHVPKEKEDSNNAKVLKLDVSADVHGYTWIKVGENPNPRNICCMGSYRLWEGRKKTQKKLTIPSNIDCIKTEEIISDALYKELVEMGAPSEPIISFTCVFEPILEPESVRLTFLDTGSQTKTFMDLMVFFQGRIPSWIERYMRFLKHKLRSQPLSKQKQ